jgi:hypothetical protein
METATISPRPDKVYLVWMGGEDEQYYNQYFSLSDAVTSNEEDTEILVADVRSLGRFKVVVKLVKNKKRSKRSKGKK